MIRRPTLLAVALAALAPAVSLLVAASAPAAPEDFGLEAVEASLSTTQAGAHPDLTFTFEVKQDPASEPNAFGFRDAYAATRNVRFELPSGLVGDPNVLGRPQQCPAAELAKGLLAECPNGSQVGVAKAFVYGLTLAPIEPVYMMQPPGGDVVARVGFVAGLFPTFVDFRVRSESDYGIVADTTNLTAEDTVLRAEVTTWGVPADPSHHRERCTPVEALFAGCVESEFRPPGSLPLPFMTNPTRCNALLEMKVSVASWVEPDRFDTKSAIFPPISGCDRLPFGPSLVIEPTNRRAAAPSGLDVTARAPASDGVDVLEPSQTRDIRVTLPVGLAVNPALGDGLETCSATQAKFGERVAAQCPDAAKLAGFEADIAALPRKMKGAIYLREPEPGNPFRVWAVADDLGVHIKLPGQLNVDKATGQIESVLLDLPQAPLREVKLLFKSGFRAPLVNPPSCDSNPSTPERDPYLTDYEFTPWSGGPPVRSSTPMTISEGCDTGGFAPKLSAGTVDPAAGKHSPFLFTLIRSDGEQNPASLDITLPKGLAASFKGIPRCEGAEAASGACPEASRIGKVIAAVGAGPAPLWVPQPGKRPTAVYLAGLYKGAPLSIVAVVPRQAGPFDFGDEVVRSAIYVDPITAQATIKSDPLPQRIEGIPIGYRTIHVAVERPDFTLNPTGCGQKQVAATVTSSVGGLASPSAGFRATDCAKLRFKPKLSLRLSGGTTRGAFPKLRVAYRPRPGDANLKRLSLRFPRSEFIEQGHIRTICTRVQYAAGAGHGSQCPQGSIYGHVRAMTPLLDEPLEGQVFLRSSSHNLPDAVLALHGPPSLPVEVEAVVRIDSVRGGLRTTVSEAPDVPISEVVVAMQGGRKGLLVNSRDLCDRPARAKARLDAHNGRRRTLRPKMKASCGKRGTKKRAG